MDTIKISVIVPVFNTEKYLKKCLDSIINQSLKEIEIIIVNDASQDNSQKIIAEYVKVDKRIKSIEKTKNEGLSEARNIGIKEALKNNKDGYIVHIDSDDWIEENYFKDMYELAIKENADIVISDFYIDHDNGDMLYRVDQIKDEKLNQIECINRIFNYKAYPAVWNKLIRKDLYIKNKIFHIKEISMGEDLVVIPKLLYVSNRIFKINRAYVHYIRNHKSISNKKDLKQLLSIDLAIKELENYFEKNESINIENLKFYQLTSLLMFITPDFKSKEYNNILMNYLRFLKEIKNTKASIKIKLYLILLKKFNNKKCFLFIWKINNFLKKIKFL